MESVRNLGKGARRGRAALEMESTDIRGQSVTGSRMGNIYPKRCSKHILVDFSEITVFAKENVRVSCIILWLGGYGFRVRVPLNWIWIQNVCLVDVFGTLRHGHGLTIYYTYIECQRIRMGESSVCACVICRLRSDILFCERPFG